VRYTTPLAVAVLAAQTFAAQTPGPQFDVASVKPAAPGRPIGELIRAMRRVPGQWRFVDLTLFNIIVIAYPEFHLPGLVVGEPAWVKEARFDVDARMNPATTPDEVNAMARRLLVDRFGLQTHTERRTVDVYVLTVAEPGKLGPGLTPASAPCVEWRTAGGTPPKDCDLSPRNAAAGMTIPAATMSEFVDAISLRALASTSSLFQSAIDRPVIDRTGLEGYFQIVGPSPVGGDPGSGASGSFFTLIQEQLGLKLTRARETVDVLVIDAVRMPDPN
jgi:uncharacterized protein (TIGR03435 family)